MTENVAILLAVLVAANALLIVVVAWRSWAQRRRSARYDAAVEAIVATPVGRPPAGPLPGLTASAALDTRPAPNRTDALTGALLPAEWRRMLADEDARFHRYRRPATVVLLELEGLDGFVTVLGQSAADRVLTAVADTLMRHARSSDHVARLGHGRFAVLLPETGEIEAINFVERVRALCDLWLESGAIALRLAIGWASPAAGQGLADAYEEAQERMYSELRRGVRSSGGSDATESESDETATELEGAPSPA
jgi:diguanylate cyclase (GGDEF)-like protein